MCVCVCDAVARWRKHYYYYSDYVRSSAAAAAAAAVANVSREWCVAGEESAACVGRVSDNLLFACALVTFYNHITCTERHCHHPPTTHRSPSPAATHQNHPPPTGRRRRCRRQCFTEHTKAKAHTRTRVHLVPTLGLHAKNLIWIPYMCACVCVRVCVSREIRTRMCALY